MPSRRRETERRGRDAAFTSFAFCFFMRMVFRYTHAGITHRVTLFATTGDNWRFRVSYSEYGSFILDAVSSTMIGIWQLVLMFNVALANSGVDLTRVSAHGRTNGADAWPIRCRNGCRPSSTCTECTRGRVNPYRRSCDTF